MTSAEYSPRTFLRQSPNALLARYFHGRDLLTDVDIASLNETDIDQIFEAWMLLPDNACAEIDVDFRDVESLANEVGTRTLLEEARYHGLDLGTAFSEMDGFYDRSLWCFLGHKEIFTTAVRFAEVELLPKRYWRKRQVPNLAPQLEGDAIAELESNLSAYYREWEGRGQFCKIDLYRRARAYLFAYLPDYGRTDIEWEGSGFSRRRHRPSFEIVFVYSQNEGVLEVCADALKKTRNDLQEIFARVILGTELGDPQQDERAYDLNLLKRRDFQFVYDPSSGIRDVRVKRMRLSSLGGKRRITLEDDPSVKREAIYDFLEDVVDVHDRRQQEGGFKMPLALLNITKAGIEVELEGDGRRGRKTRTFDLTYPNSCNLKFDERDLLIRRMLVDSGIDVSPVEAAAARS